MDKKIIEQINKDLLARKKQIEDELADIAEKGNEDELKTKFPEYGDKTDENAKEIDEYSTNLATEKVIEKTLRDINKALDRIKKNKYGKCNYCGKDIPEARILARPASSACVDCKEKAVKVVEEAKTISRFLGFGINSSLKIRKTVFERR